MKIFKPKRHLPVGWDWEKLRFSLYRLHGLSSLSILSFLSRYFRARSLLYRSEFGADGFYHPVLDPARTIAPFASLMGGLPLAGMYAFFAMMAISVWRFYAWHSRDTMSIYTMRRLPDRWELHRRCWSQPIASCLAELVLFALLTGLCWLLWYFATPAPCRPF